MAPLGHDVLTGGMQDVSTDGQKLVIESSTTTVPKCFSIHRHPRLKLVPSAAIVLVPSCPVPIWHALVNKYLQ